MRADGPDGRAPAPREGEPPRGAAPRDPTRPEDGGAISSTVPREDAVSERSDPGRGRGRRPAEAPRGGPLESFSATVKSGQRGGVRHRDAEEALSSLLWQPYECRGSPPPPPASAAAFAFAARSAPAARPGPAAHSAPAARDGETCARDMRLEVPAPATADLPHRGTCGVEAFETRARASDECVGVGVSVNGEVMSARRPSSGAARSRPEDPQRQPQPPRLQQLRPPQPLQAPQPLRPPPTAQQQQQQHPAALLPPPYSTLPPPHAHHAPPLPVQPHAYPFQPIALRRCQYGEDSERPKTCCGGAGTRALSLRWFIAVVALAGVCCVLVGTVLGAVRAHGRAHLTVLLLMIGVGLVLVTVSGVAWRAAGRRNSSVAGNGSRQSSAVPRRTALPCARAHHPYAAMLYPEFHCRPPPPSYQASMHEYRLRLLLLDRATSPPPVTCPPPAYRPRRMVNAGPQYVGGRGARGRRRPEQIAPPSPLSAVVIQNIALESYDDIKYDDGPEIESHIVSDCKEEVQQENKEGNLVTIVQTGEDSSPVIVTVSGSMPEERPSQNHTSEIDILAHL